MYNWLYIILSQDYVSFAQAVTILCWPSLPEKLAMFRLLILQTQKKHH